MIVSWAKTRLKEASTKISIGLLVYIAARMTEQPPHSAAEWIKYGVAIFGGVGGIVTREEIAMIESTEK